MAASGTIQAAIRTGYRLQIAWTVGSQSVANNTSSVTAKVQLVSTGSSYTINSSASKSGSLTINGTKYTFSFSAALNGNQTKTLFTKTVTVAHASDGSKTCAFAATCGINVTLGGTYYGNVTASGNGTFNTIPRATVPTLSASSVNMGASVTINMPRASGSFDHTLTYSFGKASGTIGSGLGTSKTWEVPISLASQIPSGTSGTCTITCKTYNGSTLIGTKSVSFKAKVPDAVVPTISNVSITETVSGLAARFGAFVQGKSKVKIGIVAVGAFGSTIKAYKTTVDGKSYSGTAPTTGTLSSGTKAVTITVTDSRGRKATATRTITVIAYSAPTIRGLSPVRALADGTANYDGQYGKIGFSYSVATIGGKNESRYTLEYKGRDSTEWIQIQAGTGYTLSTSILTGPVMDVDSAYDVRLSVTDYFTTTRKTVEIPTAFTLLDFNASGRGAAFGKVSELADGLEIGLDMSIYKDIFMGGSKRTDDEKNMYFQSTEDATNVHNCKLYGGNGNSVTSIGCWDSARSIGIWRYLTGTKNMVIDKNVTLTHGNGGDEFITSGDVTHANHAGRVLFSNGLLIQWGRESITPVANTPTKKDVTFAVAYTDTPVVITTPQTAVPGTVVTGSAAASITATGFDCYVTRTGTTATSIGWLAVGYRAPQ
jgi:hypothetical protein